MLRKCVACFFLFLHFLFVITKDHEAWNPWQGSHPRKKHPYSGVILALIAKRVKDCLLLR